MIYFCLYIYMVYSTTFVLPVSAACCSPPDCSLSPNSTAGKEIVLLHKEWLSYTWPSYTPEAHRGLAAMYVSDPRFTAYYDRAVSGCTQFLHDAVTAFA